MKKQVKRAPARYRGMPSYELLREVFAKPQVKNLALLLHRSPVLLYKWTEQPGLDQSGRKNPLDWMQALLEATDDRPLEWLCLQRDGFFVRNARGKRLSKKAWRAQWDAVLEEELRLALLAEELRAQGPSQERIRQLRRLWERVKPALEALVRAGERAWLGVGFCGWLLAD